MSEWSNGRISGFHPEGAVSTTVSDSKRLSPKNDWRRDYDRNRYHQRMQWARDLLGGKCVSCGIKENLQFDHIDRSQKSFTITAMNTLPKAKLLEELKKCQLLCKPCHDVKTIPEIGRVPRAHGRMSMYNLGCRCQECRKSQSDRMREYGQRSKRITVNGKRIRVPLWEVNDV